MKTLFTFALSIISYCSFSQTDSTWYQTSNFEGFKVLTDKTAVPEKCFDVLSISDRNQLGEKDASLATNKWNLKKKPLKHFNWIATNGKGEYVICTSGGRYSRGLDLYFVKFDKAESEQPESVRLLFKPPFGFNTYSFTETLAFAKTSEWFYYNIYQN